MHLPGTGAKPGLICADAWVSIHTAARDLRLSGRRTRIVFVSLRSHPRAWCPLRVALWLGIAATGFATPLLDAVTLQELLDNPKLSAKKYASYFGDFAYEFNSAIQPPETFLARKRGDCDDYAVLANYVLREHGIESRLVHVRLAGRVAHAVCYVPASNAYLDYNNRGVLFTLTRCGPELRDIAAKVAASLESNWTSASEFTYSYQTRRKIMIATVSKTGGTGRVPGQNSPFHVE